MLEQIHRIRGLVRNLRPTDEFLRSGRLWVTLSVVLLATEVALSVCFWWWLTSDKESVSITIRNVGLVMAGTVALPMAIWRGLVANHQASAAQQQAETAQKSLLNARYERGAEMLGNNVPSVRLGGIYALERLASEYPEEYHLEVMKLFCTFVRNPTQDESVVTPGRSQFMMSELREDTQAAVTAIGRRSRKGIELEEEVGVTPLDLFRADLMGANLAGLNLAGADLREARLARANLMNTDLAGAFLAGAQLVDPYYIRDRNELDVLDRDLEARTLLMFKGANVSGTYFSIYGMYRATSIIQEQLDNACADPDDPPWLDGVIDATNYIQLVWRGEACKD